MKRVFRRALPDACLVLGVIISLAGAYMLGQAVLILVIGLGLVGLAFWMEV